MIARVLVTGATGFVGTALVKQLTLGHRVVRIAVRRKGVESGSAEVIHVASIGPETDWTAALDQVDCVIHCGARAHVLQDDVADPLAAYREVNVAGTQRLAEQASQCGVRRLIFMSSIKVNGERTAPGMSFSFSDPAAPTDPYGQSKWEAERMLHDVASRSELDVVIVRSPLVYGPGAKGNFARLINLVERGVPLPLGAVRNRRSMVSLENLIDLLIRCIDHPAASGQTFLVSDGEDLSTPELVRRQGNAMNRPVRLLNVPVGFLRIAGRLVGRSMEVERLVGSLQVDISHTRNTLVWTPPLDVDEGLRRAAKRIG